MQLHRQFVLAAETMGSRVGEYEKMAESARQKAEWYRQVNALLKGLRTGWRDEDPGKYGPHAFFVKEIAYADGQQSDSGLRIVERCERIWVTDLVDDLTTAKAGLPQCRYGVGNGRREVPLGSFADIRLDPCVKCARGAPLVGNYRQTYDSPDGDEWRLDVYTMCMGCPDLTLRAARVSEHRFM